ncbi:MAG: hypothetical protein LC750_15035, partial [Actinobacteria bacterium]|nr:hypothetical protein [Actinomycetota bacterium]
YEAIPGTSTDNSPKTPMYFHGTTPEGNLEPAWPTWNGSRPSGSGAKVYNSVAGSVYPIRFEGATTKALQGDMIVNFWGAMEPTHSLLPGTWHVAIYAPDEDHLIGEGTSQADSQVTPSKVSVVVRGIVAPANSPLVVTIDGVYIVDGAHYAVYYDSVDMPSGMLLPTSPTINAPLALARDLGVGGSVELTWPTVAGAATYRLYEGSSPDSLHRAPAVLRTLKGPSSSSTITTIDGFANFANPAAANGAVGITEAEFLATCDFDSPPDDPDSNLVTQGTADGYVIKLPAGSGDGKQRITVKGVSDFPYDFDVDFYTPECDGPVDDYYLRSGSDESGKIPKGSGYAIVTLVGGVASDFTATITHPAMKAVSRSSSSVSATVRGLADNQSSYFRVVAVNKSGVQGRQSGLISVVPTAFARVVEVSVEGGPWTTVPVRLTTPTSGTWSVPLSSLSLTSASPSGVRVRARAGDAVGPATTTMVLGKRLARDTSLPATGLGDDAFGAVLLALAGGIAIRSRRRKTA